jgi:dTDP-4-dehydrorhamnose 3,5-epimerase
MSGYHFLNFFSDKVQNEKSGGRCIMPSDNWEKMGMKVIPTAIPDVLIIEPQVFGDDRGFFYESFNQREFAQKTGLERQFVQDNHSRSAKNVLRGLHYQIQNPQGKLVRVVTGEVLDVAVDLRQSSPTFGQWVSCLLNAENKRMFWVPEGFAHGFAVRSPYADFLYKTTNYYSPQHERTLLWNDPTLAIDWLLDHEPTLSAKDKLGLVLEEVDRFE